MSSFYAAENTAVCMSLVFRRVATETRRFTDGYRQIQTNTDNTPICPLLSVAVRCCPKKSVEVCQCL